LSPVIRDVRPGDGEGCARVWLDAGRYYAALVPDVIQVPEADGLAGWFEAVIGEEAVGEERDGLWLVADERGAGVVGMVEARVVPPAPDARRQLQRDLGRTRLVVDLLAVAEGYRRRGVGTALMEAAEEWGRSKGAYVAVTDTNLSSPLSVPFYEERMGFARQAVILRKVLHGG
jgi:GNAT superfamily N-acetyltransferase